MYHLWTREHRPTARKKTFEEEKLKSQSQVRIRDLLCGRLDLQNYGLGECRSLSSFEEGLALNFKNCIFFPGANFGGYPGTIFEESSDELFARAAERIFSSFPLDSTVSNRNLTGNCEIKYDKGNKIGLESVSQSELNKTISALELVKQFMVESSVNRVNDTNK